MSVAHVLLVTGSMVFAAAAVLFCSVFISRRDRATLNRLGTMLDRIDVRTHQGELGAAVIATNLREAQAAVHGVATDLVTSKAAVEGVATDLANAHQRADAVHQDPTAPPGAAADEAAKSGTNGNGQ